MTTNPAQAQQRAAAALREIGVAANIPYERHLSPSIVETTMGDLVCVLKLSGAPFECASNADINVRHARLNRVLVNLADPRITVWQHIVRREESRYPGGEFPPGYAHDLNVRYMEKLNGEVLMANELYLSVVYRALPWLLSNTVGKLFTVRSLEQIAADREQQTAELDSIVNGLVASLGYYEAERLTMYEHAGLWFSEPAEYFGYLVNGVWERVPVERCPLKSLIGTTRPRFKDETVVLRRPSSRSFSAMLGINEYPSNTPPQFLDQLLAVPCEVVVTQSFTFMRQEAALGEMGRTQGKMENAGDPAKSQIAELPEAADALASHRTVFGAQHYSVEVKGASVDELERNIDIVRAILTDAGIKTAREDLACEGAYWARLPGAFDKRKRLSTIHSGNVSGFMPLHNFPMGRRDGNHWGPALTMLVTAGGTPYYFNLHASDPSAPNGGGKKDVGHTFAFGPNGSGKTAAAMFCLSMAQKYRPTAILFSKDRDSEITARMLGATIYRAEPGLPLFNLFSLDPEEKRTLPHLRRVVRKLVARPYVTASGVEADALPLSPLQETMLDKAINSVLRLTAGERRLGRVLDFVTDTSLAERLAPWCYARPGKAGTKDGVHAWVFDNPVDHLTSDFGNAATTVFDITNFIDDHELRAPLILHLFHLTRRLIDGRRLAVFVSEFWKLLGDPLAAEEGKDLVKTVRKKNGFAFLDTNSLGDALNLPIGRTLIEQAATLMLFPNPAADRKEYMEEGLNLTRREFDLINTELPEGSGMFLLKQGHYSVVVQLPLAGMDDDLAVLSARTANLALMDRLIEQYGEAPEAWYPHFQQQRRSA